MNNALLHTPIEPDGFNAAIEAACRVIAPSWPLDRQIAVNPYWGFIAQPFAQTAASVRRLVGGRIALPTDVYLAAWRSGEITPSALHRALAETSAAVTPDDAVAALQRQQHTTRGLPLLSDVIDEHSPSKAGPRWQDTITQQVSQYCASYFDSHQAEWHRNRTAGLYAGWRAALLVDHAVKPLMQAPQISTRARELPHSPEAAITWALQRLEVPLQEATEFLQVCLLRINGWASWCAYLGWQASLEGTKDSHLRELLAIRACWEALLHDGQQTVGSHIAQWREHWSLARRTPASAGDACELIWQRAQEISYQDQLIALLHGAQSQAVVTPAASRPGAQLIFCIDVRSERFRRALEATDSNLETKGFAGFFGLPIQRRLIGTQLLRPQLPGLLGASLEVNESTGQPATDALIAARRNSQLQAIGQRQSFHRLPTGAFSLVETIGLGYAAAILRRHFGSPVAPPESFALTQPDARALRPQLTVIGPDAIGRKADLVASILRAMSLTSGFARLLVLVGHGSQSANNPQAAALDCGACGGQTGEVNARVLAGLLNDSAIRAALHARGIAIPADTVAIGALHNTTTDELSLLDIDLCPATHARDIQSLQVSLQTAGHRTRVERAPDLGLREYMSSPKTLLNRLRARACDWAETRPEWGLANNAALIIAPRARTRGLDLAGRSFLHDYVAADDPDGKVLELIMTAPMIVTHWINLQYYASTVDPERFGSGNKVLHNVACGMIGVFEGNTGDLRIGLARQSLHDGKRWMHTPLRQSVVIDAPRDRIEAILARHETVRQLVANQWLYLFRFAASGIEWHCDGQWRAWTAGGQAS